MSRRQSRPRGSRGSHRRADVPLRAVSADAEAELELTEERAPSRWRRRVGWGIAWGVLTTLVVVSARTVDWGRVLVELRTVRPGWLALALVANTLVLVGWTQLWRELVPRATPVGFRTMFGINTLTSAVMNTTPLLVGHASAIALLVRRAGLTSSGAFGVIALDQLGEGVSKVLVLLLAALALPLPTWMRSGIIAVAIAVAVLLGVLLVFAHGYRPATLDDARPHGRVRAAAERWARDLEVLRSWERAGMALVWAIAMKACEGLGILCVQHALGVHLPLAQVPVVMSAVILATMLPLSPGNLGPYEAATMLAYRYLGIPTERALSIALIQHLAFLVPAIGIGYVMLFVRSRHEAKRPVAE